MNDDVSLPLNNDDEYCECEELVKMLEIYNIKRDMLCKERNNIFDIERSYFSEQYNNITNKISIEFKLMNEIQNLIVDNYNIFKSNYLSNCNCIVDIIIRIFDFKKDSFGVKLMSIVHVTEPTIFREFHIKDIEIYYDKEIDIYLIELEYVNILDKKLYQILIEKYPSIECKDLTL